MCGQPAALDVTVISPMQQLTIAGVAESRACLHSGRG